MASLINRNGNYYIQWCVGGKAKRRSLGTTNAKIAEEHLRQYESSETRGLRVRPANTVAGRMAISSSPRGFVVVDIPAA